MKTSLPPKLAQRFFSWYCRNELRDSILGDLDEKFYQDLSQKGSFRAKINYWLGVLGFMNRFTLRRNQEQLSGSPLGVFKNHFISSIRFLNRNRRYALINVLGLTLGLTSCLLIFWFVRHEFSFDTFHKNKANIYRVNAAYEDNSGNVRWLVNSPPALTPGIHGVFPELEKASRMRYAMRNLFKNGDRSFYEDKGYYADSLFLEIFGFKFSSGDRWTALDEPNTIVLTREMALKYFDAPDPVGSTLLFNNDLSLKVTGVIEEVPSNSHLDFDYLISFSTYVVPDGYASNLESWWWLGFLTYVQLADGSDPVLFQEKLDQRFAEISGSNHKPYKTYVQNLTEIYLGSSDMPDDLASPIRSGNRLTLYSLSLIAGLILVIAGFNFMNLSGAISIHRSKSIGIRKVLGAHRKSLISQLMMESIFLGFGCLILSYLIAFLLFPVINRQLGWEVVVGFSDVLATLPLMLGIALLVGLIAGASPSMILSGFKIIPALKGEVRLGSRSPFQLKNALVLVQFCISIGLIASTLVFTQQINYLRNQSTGFDKENVVVIKLLPGDMARYYKTYKELLLQQASILGVTRSERVLGDPWPINSILVAGEDESQSKVISGNLVDYDYFKTMGIQLKQGRAFSEAYQNDSLGSIVISEQTADYLGLDDPIGQQVHFFSFDGPRTIIGVVEDFNYASLHSEIGPAVMILPFINLEHLYVRVAPGNVLERVTLLEDTWEQVSPGTPLEIRFLDDKIHQLYQSEERLSSAIQGFAVLAIMLACLGLYGLVAFMINNRMKEVGVRKVLGAPRVSLLLLFTKQYVYQVIVAMLISIPVLHYFLNQWLNDFAYRIAIPWWVYPVAALFLMIIALLTMTYQSLKAANTNPVEVLRSE